MGGVIYRLSEEKNPVLFHMLAIAHSLPELAVRKSQMTSVKAENGVC
jgi:hypothetical protein